MNSTLHAGSPKSANIAHSLGKAKTCIAFMSHVASVRLHCRRRHVRLVRCKGVFVKCPSLRFSWSLGSCSSFRVVGSLQIGCSQYGCFCIRRSISYVITNIRIELSRKHATKYHKNTQRSYEYVNKKRQPLSDYRMNICS